MLWKLLQKHSLHGGSLGHMFVHRSYIMQRRNYTPDEKISSGMEMCCSFKTVLGQEPYLEFRGTKKPLEPFAFKILSFGSYMLLSAFIELFKTYLEATIRDLL
jgi:hypothetical protein